MNDSPMRHEVVQLSLLKPIKHGAENKRMTVRGSMREGGEGILERRARVRPIRNICRPGHSPVTGAPYMMRNDQSRRGTDDP